MNKVQSKGELTFQYFSIKQSGYLVEMNDWMKATEGLKAKKGNLSKWNKEREER